MLPEIRITQKKLQIKVVVNYDGKSKGWKYKKKHHFQYSFHYHHYHTADIYNYTDASAHTVSK